MRPVPKPSRKSDKPSRLHRNSRLAIYNQLVKPAYLEGLAAGQLYGDPYCEICRKTVPLEIHHKAGREGRLLFDARYFMAVCPDCHRHIHANPEESYRLNRLIRRNSLAQLPEGVEELVAEGGAAASEED